MKTLITILTLITMVVAGITSLHFFRESQYNLSSLLIIATYFSIVLCIYAISVYKPESFIK
jgi:hypothetical protein